MHTVISLLTSAVLEDGAAQILKVFHKCNWLIIWFRLDLPRLANGGAGSKNLFFFSSTRMVSPIAEQDASNAFKNSLRAEILVTH